MTQKRTAFSKSKFVPNRWTFSLLGIIISAILYIAFLSLDIFAPQFVEISSMLKWSSIIFLFVLQIPFFNKTNSLWLLAAGLTVVADYFLLFTHAFVGGIAIFIAAQAARCFVLRKREAFKVLGFAVLMLICLLLLLNRLFAVALIYAALLLINFIFALQLKEGKLILAFLLFILCDINVVLFNLMPFGLISELAAFLMWFFYLPSQLLLAIYGIRKA